MIVAKNSLIMVNEKCDFQDLKKTVEKHVYPNLYKLLQVINNSYDSYYLINIFFKFNVF